MKKGIDSLNGLRKVYQYHYKRRTDLLGVQRKPFEKVLRKCPFIRRISLDIAFNGKILMIIGKYCRQLREFECLDMSLLTDRWLLEFGTKFGQRLKSIKFGHTHRENIDLIINFLNHCPNVMSVDVPHIQFDNLFLPALKEIKEIVVRDAQVLKVLADKYCKTVRKVCIYIYGMIGPNIRLCVQYISRLEKLTSLKLFVVSQEQFNSAIDESIAQMVVKCKRLKKLQINFFGDHYYSEAFLLFLSDVRSLEILDIWLRTGKRKRNLDGNVELFRMCSKLRHFYIGYINNVEDFCEDIQLFLPNLTFLCVGSENPVSETFFASLSTMKYLQKVIFYWHIIPMKKTCQRDYYFGKYLNKMDDKTAIRWLTTECGVIDRGWVYE